MIHLKSVLFLIIFLLSVLASGQPATTIIADADEMIKDTPSQTLTLKGNVNVIFQQQHLLCDKAIVYEDTKTLVAEGNVILQNPRTTLRGDKIEFNYEENKGTIYNGVVTSGRVLLQADVIKKVGEDEYEADEAYYTSCTTCPPSWGFTAANVKAEIGGYAYISRPWLHLLEFPVLPLPYLVVPLNSKRQTGFLVPKPLSTPDGGFSIEVPFFWAIDKSHDATFSFLNHEFRGPQLVTNYRYVTSEKSSGELNTGFIRDRSIENLALRNRWFIDYGHHYDLPNDYTQRTRLALASDRKYAFDYFFQFPHNGEPALENSVSLSKSFENSLLTLESSFYLSQIEQEFRFDGDQSLHRLPEINFNMTDQKISEDIGLYFSLDLQYLNIARSNGLAFEHTRSGAECTTYFIDDNGNITTNPDNPGTPVCYPTALSNGQFVYGPGPDGTVANNTAYGDLIRTGQRFDVSPRIHAPFWIGNIFDVDPSFSVRYTQYSLGVQSDPNQGYDSFPSRFYTEFGVSTKSYISKVVEWDQDTKLRHSVIPRVDLRYIPEVYKSNHNFFGNQDSLKYVRELQPIDDSDVDWRNGGRGVQFDANDRIIGKQILTLGLSNIIVSRDKKQDKNYNSLSSQYQRNFLFDVNQTFDMHELRKGNDARPWQAINTLTELRLGPLSQIVSTATYPYHNRTIWNTNTQLRFLGRNYIGIGYSKFYTIPLEPPVDEDTRRETVNLTTGLYFPYFYISGRVMYDLNPIESSPNNNTTSDFEKQFPYWQIASVITPPGSCWSILGSMEQALGQNKPTISISMEFKFGE